MSNFFNFDTTLLLQAFGLVFLGLGVVIRTGTWKRWYWASKTSGYSYFPIGIVFLMYSFNDQVSARLGSLAWIYLACYAIPVGVGIWWTVHPPTFVKPKWARWVEAYPEKAYQAMKKDALADPRWERHVASENSLRDWARSLGQPIPHPDKEPSKT